MQLKHPEILWALLLLIIPILIHLFQLRRFQKTPFTNVAMLQKVVMESRKSNTLKKWLLLFTRLLLLAALIIAFAQPFTAKNDALQEKETIIYLDNSFSMQAGNNGVSLLEKATQDLLKHIDREQTITLFTNTNTFRDVTVKDVQNQLLAIPFTFKQMSLDDIFLKANTLFSSDQNSRKNLILISDFQKNLGVTKRDSVSLVNNYIVPLKPDRLVNVAIDSVSIEDTNDEQLRLSVFLSSMGVSEPIPVSLFNGETLIAKSAADFEENSRVTLDFSIPNNEPINGLLNLVDGGLVYDNAFYLNLDNKEKTKVLSISETIVPNNYLSRLFGNAEFELTQYPLNGLDYSLLDTQNVIVLDNLKSIPTGLSRILSVFNENGGSLIIIPAETSNVDSYNQLLSSHFNTSLGEKLTVQKRITNISYDHPVYRNVFERQIENFQYPQTNQYYRISTRAPKILSFEGNDPFLVGLDGFYLFTSPLQSEISNFKSSSLIVPTFYNMAKSGLQAPELFLTLGKTNTIDIGIELGSENIVQVKKLENQFIPLQQSFPNKVRLTFNENPTEDGIYEILTDENLIKHISFNYPRNESPLEYLEPEDLMGATTKESVGSLFQLLEKESSITSYWKWFVILALLLALVEVIIQKFVT
ncbi:BatA domain-containing protein [Flagellimonas sp.]|uniref:BatA domain-containing protein n=1 Tax=Flagellimonas sp. TaxID=2058762 RepID=UPI003F49E72F